MADLWLRLGRTESQGHAFYRAARWIDRETHDLVVLAREGNLAVVTWLEPESRAIVEEIATEDRCSLLHHLQQEYVQPSSETA